MKVLAQYTVGPVEVQIVEAELYKYYNIYEPVMPEECSPVLSYLKEYFTVHIEADPGKPEDRWIAAEVLGLADLYDRCRHSIDYYLTRDLQGYGKLDPLIRDPGLEEVAVDGTTVKVVHRDYEGWFQTNLRFRPGEAEDLAYRLAYRSGSSISPAFPLQEFRLPEGHRVTVALAAARVSKNTTITIRKFPEEPLTLEDLVARRMMSRDLAALLEIAVLAKGMVLIVGPQGSGKTTLMGALLDRVPGERRIVTVEEVPELRLKHSNWVALYPREPQVLDPLAERARIGFRQLLKAALRMRSDYVAVAEARGEEVRYIFEAAALGSGSLATFHAGGLEELMRRLSILGIGEDLLDLVWLVVVTGIIPGLGRRVVEVYSREDSGWARIAYWRREDDSHVVGLEKAARLRDRLAHGLGVSRNELDRIIIDQGRLLARS
ncbi:MAG: type II/IV secretion system ATPase subunit [Desulfurococcales archaeon]|nr:type II/IV secretion system ATPase subunit [Desulfurococcales archaeon]